MSAQNHYYGLTVTQKLHHRRNHHYHSRHHNNANGSNDSGIIPSSHHGNAANNNNNNNDHGNILVVCQQDYSKILFSFPAPSTTILLSSPNNNCITYDQASNIIIEHELWLTSIILRQQQQYQQQQQQPQQLEADTTFNDMPATTTATTTTTTTTSATIIIKDIIVAYLSDNSPDLLLSLLACMNLTLSSSEGFFEQRQQHPPPKQSNYYDPKNNEERNSRSAAGTNTTNIDNWRQESFLEQQQQHHKYHQTIEKRNLQYNQKIEVVSPSFPIILPAMLNCRWTALEIVNALSPFRNNTAAATKTTTANTTTHSPPQRGSEKEEHVYITILLYGEGYETLAKEVEERSNILSKTTRDRKMNRKQGNNDDDDDGTTAKTLFHHVVMAIPLPELSRRYYNKNYSNYDNTQDDVILDDTLELSRKTKLPIPPPQSSFSSTSATTATLSSSSTRGMDEYHDVSQSDALLLFTSGTTSTSGIAKGVKLSHRSLYVQGYAKTFPPCSYDKETCIMANTVPWFHVGGISSTLAVMMAGGCIMFPPLVPSASSPSNVENGSSNNIARRRIGGGFHPNLVLQSLSIGETSSIIPISPSPLPSMSSYRTVNTLVVVPAMLHAIILECTNIYNRSSRRTSFPNVRLILVGGQSIITSGNNSIEKKYKLYNQTRTLFPNARIVQTYACTEAGSSITFDELHEGGEGMQSTSHNCNTSMVAKDDDNDDECYGGTSVGVPPQHIQVAIFHSEATTTAKETSSNASSSYISLHNTLRTIPLLPHGQTGIIGTRGPHVMSGYWNRSTDNTHFPPSEHNSNSNNDKTENDGWMLTNDLGYIHPRNGKLYFRGRADDVIRTGGESVLATDVERVLIDYFASRPFEALHCDSNRRFVECSVFPLPDEKFGEAVCAAVVYAATSADTSVEMSSSLESSNNQRMATVVVEEDEVLKDQIRQYFVERQIAGYKRPRRVFCFRFGLLPRNSSGKVWKPGVVRLCAKALATKERRSRL